MDLYQIMGVARDADTAAIKKAYRKLVKECHPDTHPGDKQAEERFKRISEAYSILSDEGKRKNYDQETAGAGEKQKKGAARREAPGRPFDPADFQREFENLFSFTGKKENTNEKTDRDQGQGRKNPLDTSALFEKYMGFK